MMASSIAFPIGATFDLQTVVGQLGRSFQMKGYTIRSYPLGAGACLEVSRHQGGLNTCVGRCEGLKINFMPRGNMLNVYFSDEQWTDKVIGFVIGWFTCWIPWIFTGIGLYNQMQLPKIAENELRIILGVFSVPQTNWYQSPAGQSNTYQPYQQTTAVPPQPTPGPPQPTAAPTSSDAAGSSGAPTAAPPPSVQQPDWKIKTEPVPDPFADLHKQTVVREPMVTPDPFAQPVPPFVKPTPSSDQQEESPSEQERQPFVASPSPADIPEPADIPPIPVPGGGDTCRVCGNKVAADGSYCPYCGAKRQ